MAKKKKKKKPHLNLTKLTLPIIELSSRQFGIKIIQNDKFETTHFNLVCVKNNLLIINSQLLKSVWDREKLIPITD